MSSSVSGRLKKSGIHRSTVMLIESLVRKSLVYMTRKDIKVPCREEFVDWLRFAVPGMTSDGNERAFEFVASHLQSASPVIEIGSFCGLSTILIGHFLEKYGKVNKIYTADRWEFENCQNLDGPLGGSSLLSHGDYKEYVEQSYIRNIKTFLPKNLPHTVKAFSDEFFEKWQRNETVNDVLGREVELGGEISFCFIDGNHQYEFARRDFCNADKLLVVGGFILFDDSADFSEWEVNRLAREVKRMKHYKLVSKNPNYLFQKIAHG